MDIDLDVDLSNLESALTQAADAMANPRSGEMEEGAQDAARDFMGSVFSRFQQNSGGGGEWPDLALGTKIRRLPRNIAARTQYQLNKSKGSTKADIAASASFPLLVDKGDLIRSLMPGNYATEQLNDGLRFGTTDRKAQFHQEGTPKMPRRQIFHDPDDTTLSLMERAIAAAVESILQRAFNG